MSRKDTILIAVIINAGLLAVLFATAIIYDTEKELDQTEFDTSLAEAKPIGNHEQPKLIASAPPPRTEEYIAKSYDEPVTQPIDLEEEEFYFQNADAAPVQAVEEEAKPIKQSVTSQSDYVEVTVKKGDSLDKIAKSNGTTVSAIKKANNLTSEKLSIGQVLRIPLKKDQPVAAAAQPSKAADSPDAVYHIVKSGDSPWKIAKQYGVKYEDILKLNQLNEEKARNLKIGDRIRVK